MNRNDTPLDARRSDEWIFVPVGSLHDKVSQTSSAEQKSAIPAIPGRLPVEHTRSWPSALPSSSSVVRHPSSSRRSMSNRDIPVNLGNNNRWDWNIEKLKQLPPYYHIEATAMRFRGLSKESVSNRVSNFLRINSIPATYHGDHVECNASGFLKFMVNLWKGDSPDGIIVEVQRRTGCILQMRKLRKGLHQCITSSHTDDSTPAPANPREVPSTISNVLDRKFCHQSKKEGCQWTLQTAKRLLASDCVDQNKLGMESLLSLVADNADPADPSVASCVSGAIVCGTGKYAEDIRGAFGDYFRDTRLDNDNEDDDVFEDEDIVNKDYARGCHFGMLHNLALQVLEKALKIVLDARQQQQTSSGGNSVKKPNADIRSWFWRNIIEALIYNVEVADCRPVEAALSSKCLSLIMTLQPELQHCRCIEERLIPGLVYAHDFGRAHHLRLETESENLMSTLY